MYSLPVTGLGVGITIGLLLAGAVTLAVTSFRRPPDHVRGRGWKRWVAAALVLVVLEAGWSVNTYFDYLPNIGSLLGRRAADQAAASVLDRRPEPVLERLSAHGEVLQVDIAGVDSHFAARPAEVYLPPAWFRSPRPRLPIIELLAGTPGTPEDWTRAGFADLVSDRFAGRNDGKAPILVMPDDNGEGFERDSECVDGRLGNAETYLTTDVTDWTDHHIESFAASHRWGIGGLSEGGYSAAELALRHPRRYALFLDFGGLDEPTHPGGPRALFAGPASTVRHDMDEHELGRLLRGHSAHAEAGWFEVGSMDGSTTRDVIDAAAQGRLLADSVLVVRSGGHHTFRVWGRSFTDSLAWAANRLGLGACTVQTHGRTETHPCDVTSMNRAERRPHDGWLQD